MTERFEDLIDPLEREALLRTEVLYAADTHEQNAETMDRPARIHAVDQYIQWATDESDMPLPTKRIRLAPPDPGHIMGGAIEAYINYPLDRQAFMDAERHSQMVFVRIVTIGGESQRYLITPGRFLAFNNSDELAVDQLLLELNEFSEQDPGAMFITSSPDTDTVDSEETLAQLQLISQIINTYKLKAQPFLYPQAS